VIYKKKLIEVALPLAAINAASAREKSIRHGHPSTLHLWWARRPLAAARAVLWASLVDDPSAHPETFPTEDDQLVERKRLFEILERLVTWEASNDPRIIAEAKAEIERSCDGDLPKVLDPFGGGGAIPLEAMRLGLPTYTGDLNPVAVLIQRAMLEIPSRFAGRPPVAPNVQHSQGIWDGARGLASDVETYGKWMFDEAQRRIGHLYPPVILDNGKSATPIAWIWARTVKSPDPSWPGHVPLVRSWILSRRPGKPTVWVNPVVDRQSKDITYEVCTGGTPPLQTVERGNGTCVATGASIPGAYIKDEASAGRMGSVLLAVVAEGPSGRVYVSATNADREAERVAIPDRIPSETIPYDPRNIWVTNYGLTKWSDLFSARQLTSLSTFSDLLVEVRGVIEADAKQVGLADDHRRLHEGGVGVAAYSEAVITYLAFAIDKAANLWSSIVGWMNDRGAFREVFARQAIPMTWDFAEANPFSGQGGSWPLFIDKIKMAIEHSPTGQNTHIAQRDARARIAEVGTCLISTDPPYYDNISYADLSDFFYVWLRRNLRDVWPDECATLVTPKAEELIANQYRAGSKQAANEHFEHGMEVVFREAAANADPRFPATVFYAFKATESTTDGITSTGWETFLHGLLEAGYAISATWPVRTESPGRIVALGTNALASSIVLACRPREVTAPMATRGEFITALNQEMESSVRILQQENIAPVDLAQSAMGPGISIFSRYARVVEADGSTMTVRSALGLINDVLSGILSGEESEFDPDTRFALTWFEQFGNNPGKFGEADLLARAKNTTVDGVAEAGVVISRDGSVRLVERGALPEDWDPATDRRFTVWEATQYLIRALDASETDAAALLARLGTGVGDRARQLAYLLYGVCDKKRWSEEAGYYNMLVTAWPELVRLASVSTPEPNEERLF